MSSPRERPTGASSSVGYDQGNTDPSVGYDQPGTSGARTGQPDASYGQRQAGRHEYDGTDEGAGKRAAVVGGTALAGFVMLLAGLWSVTVGIVGLNNGTHVIASPNYTFSYSIHNWAWTELILGIVVFAAGVCVFLGMAWARYVGAVLAVLSAIANFAFIPRMPLWSITLVALDVFVIWALLTPRRRSETI